ncbi:GbsR/MarR family transcriptional regulator [Algoriphagus zhangzhouensis]|uniref:DNA-binding transcriptional regulator GbsR, MarR family n=1 Tax=Algoriphagus zhangzhouensis TaxID=1073327 RepID=A0A1M7Z9E9_9BACT|nr:MarR family transcriptional regulator [Algoriphagus zhangzhouensis]TDY47381.1 DNA-binding transcriptional regulator GbsR (MarR family) [Algoriphagus zhangzhouensis]SHO61568.1 DNA-binding transcriptional regulator GbsR, MarR family [Algoriphagus zhangzhouensis]
MVLSEKQKELIERIGVFHEHKGMQPLVGRIIGLMLIHDNAEVTFDEIVDLLGVSKSAVSNALTFLQAKERVVYTTKPGDRKRYFKLKIHDWKENFTKDIVGIVEIQKFLAEVLEERKDKDSEFCAQMRDFSNFLEFFRHEIPSLFERFKKKYS